MSLPPVDPAVTAEAVAALPARLRKRLDDLIPQALTWPVSPDGDRVTVRPDDQTSVTLAVPVTAAADAVCTCLLAPRCLHRAAVLSAAPIHTATPPPGDAPESPASPATLVGPASSENPASSGAPASPGGPATGGPASPGGPASGAPAPPSGPASGAPAPPSGPASGAPASRGGPVSPAQADAARNLWAAGAAVLTGGIPGAGAVAQADLLRAVHQARAVALHSPAAAAVRVVEMLRAARRDDPWFRLADLTDDLLDLLTACHRLTSGDGGAAGVARRDYEPVGDLRLHGLFCEPVRTVTGHAGAATYLADRTGRLWVVADVRPAESPATTATVRTSVDLGEVRLSHHELARAGLLASNAHASPTGRLSHGRARQAVSAAGAGWFDPPLTALWETDPAAQVDRWLAAAALPAHDRPAPHDLAFLDGVILGADRRGLLLAVERHRLTVAVSAPHEDPALPSVTNLRLLATHAAGLRIRLIGRFAGPRRVAGVAFAAHWLPASHGGHVDLGATVLTRADLPTTHRPTPPDLPTNRQAAPPDLPTNRQAAPPDLPTDRQPTPAGPPTDRPPAPAGPPTDGPHGSGWPGPVGAAEWREPEAPPLHLLRHQVERVVAGGRATLLSGVDSDARRLAGAQLGAASAVLLALGDAGVRRTRDVFGRLDPHDAHLLARAWLTAAVFERGAAQAATRHAWTGSTTEP
ncbi:hypothetical protein BJY16_003725 [Actinoplanes octamycinicus]|uniref:SWIM-type domain-containing protein n=1 Tax=Actinoplanes octamycinicus TaxID=135948 RepID=A0A7W7M801_9ACTN|nr:SWIM zinc finger family protein [Actinoplanes octamycinicus]MBB4740266.1 hypothetical protein [Actinoplanes octamycinicus]GIE63480.1 hypothetical protein Aoc01nite_88820 [Actinoplanes octamycinicus]